MIANKKSFAFTGFSINHLYRAILSRASFFMKCYTSLFPPCGLTVVGTITRPPSNRQSDSTKTIKRHDSGSEKTFIVYLSRTSKNA